ncbi:MAG: hypothetical protein Q9190_000550, partial [Brigantiaea leucoxantha]
MARRGRRRNSSFTRERTVSIEKRPHDDSPDENQFVRRGRRRNSSFARERALSAEKSSFSYGSKPIQRQEVSKSDSPFQSPEEQHSTRRVRMISCDTENISSEERKASPRRVIPATNPPKGILRKPRETFPEEPVVIREGVAPIPAAGKKGIPRSARWTKIDRRIVIPEALELSSERFEERADYVVVLRVLTEAEIEAYAEKTQDII